MTSNEYIKMSVGVFGDLKMKYIESLPSGDSIIVVWFKLLCLAKKRDLKGKLMLVEDIPYTHEMLARVLGQSLELIRMSLRTFETLKMIEIVDGVITVKNFDEY